MSEKTTLTRAEWCEALRSGEYRQTDGCLYDPGDDAFCCLGVALNLVGVNLKSPEMDGHSFFSDVRPLSIIGITKQEEAILSDMNDDGKTFAEIADYIEQLPVKP